MRRLTFALFAAVTLSACGDATPELLSGPSDGSAVAARALDNVSTAAIRRYRVTITNLTTGQPLSPGVLATHTKEASLFSVGQAASAGVQDIAENGNPELAATELAGARGVFDVVTTGAPVGRVGGPAMFPSTLTAEIDAAANANLLSVSLMLICTNDGFTGADAIRLPGGFQEEVHYTRAYDAGTEVNDEIAGSIVGPCFGIGPVVGPVGGNGRTGETGVVRMHPNVQGTIGDLTSAHAWVGPVARISVQRIK